MQNYELQCIGKQQVPFNSKHERLIFYKKKKKKKNVLLWQIPNSIIVVSLDLNLYKLAMTSAWPFYLHVKRLGKRLS